MIQVFRSLIDIALLRRDPGALPASAVLLVIAVVAYAGTSALQSWMLHGGDRLLARTALFLLGLIAAALILGVLGFRDETTLLVAGVIAALAAAIVPGFSVASFLAAVLGALVVSVVSWVIGFFTGR